MKTKKILSLVIFLFATLIFIFLLNYINKKDRILDQGTYVPEDKTVNFLWRGDRYDEKLQDTFNSIYLNEEYVSTISDQEKAALAFIASSIGNECTYDDAPQKDGSNLNCKIISALDLGYQCSDKHLDFIKYWFRGDEQTLRDFNCSLVPSSSTIQDTFLKIDLITEKNKIEVFYSAEGINVRENTSFGWKEKVVFEVLEKGGGLKLIERELLD